MDHTRTDFFESAFLKKVFKRAIIIKTFIERKLFGLFWENVGLGLFQNKEVQ